MTVQELTIEAINWTTILETSYNLDVPLSVVTRYGASETERMVAWSLELISLYHAIDDPAPFLKHNLEELLIAICGHLDEPDMMVIAEHFIA